MAYTIGETYIWVDGKGSVHIWGQMDSKLVNSAWENKHGYSEDMRMAGVIIAPSVWKVLKEAIIKEVLGDTAKRILIGEYSTGHEEQEKILDE